ncbi:helicase-related protein [Herpetosiphon sp. NSE202]|uniref:helicase-related protein n=1 Tax=Herpetosiphon sp. NSE202 TaxID=3351349 RepID=UPI00363F7BFD
MPRIFDNIDLALVSALRDTLALAQRADFCVGYFNLRGWRQIDAVLDSWAGGEHNCCRVLVGMQPAPADVLRTGLSLTPEPPVDQSKVLQLKQRVASDFRQQLMLGSPTNADEQGLRRLSHQLKTGKVVIKVFLRYPLHAKVYLLHRNDPINPIVGYLGSSNLTLAGLVKQGELNIDVLDADACIKLDHWFAERWDDRWCLDISAELAAIIDESWAREQPLKPYHLYLKMVYHLSQEARAGLAEFSLPPELQQQLFDFQVAAVKIAARHLKQRGGVIIGDVVGLGKTMMATALARMFEDSYGFSTLIVCPKHLETMWQHYVDTYGLRAKILPLSRVSEQTMQQIPARFRLVLIDESHNLRNREGKRYKALQTYIAQSDSKCILLSATPYNKSYLDLSAQLRLFIGEDTNLGLRPERIIRELGELAFRREFAGSFSSLAAFEKSSYPDDWRELMRRYLVRRTRSFIKANYAATDASGRRCLRFADGRISYFPERIPRTLRFAVHDDDPNDSYAKMMASSVVDTITNLTLPRYRLGSYLKQQGVTLVADELDLIERLKRARLRLVGFCRTNLFKRLESGGPAFLQSLERHILRNFIVLHALEQREPLPLGTQAMDILGSPSDADVDLSTLPSYDDEFQTPAETAEPRLWSEQHFRALAKQRYAEYRTRYHSRFKWIRSQLFNRQLQADLQDDSQALIAVLQACGAWNSAHDAKLAALIDLVQQQHPDQKLLIFTQFADTVAYLLDQLQAHGVRAVAGVVGGSPATTSIVNRFSPRSNGMAGRIEPADEIRVLVATDVLSEGQNLQDAHIIVNYDLPWAIIRLIQRAGRVDRIGQQADTIACYSFLPADGVERIIGLRSRVRQRLRQNAEVVGTDEAFFEDDDNDSLLHDLYSENAAVLEDEADTDVDLVSYAYQIWKNATDADPKLSQIIPNLPDVIYSTRQHQALNGSPNGVLIYMRSAEGNDSLAWINQQATSVTQSQLAILQAAACHPDTPALERHPQHHELVQAGIEYLVREEQHASGGLGRSSSARFRTYEQLKHYYDSVRGTLFEAPELARAIDEIYRFPLRQTATDTLNRQLRAGIRDQALAELVLALRDENRLCIIDENDETDEPRLICSLGLF